MCFTKRILVQYFSKRLLSILILFTLLPVLPQAQGQSKFWEFLVWMANGESGQDRFIRCNIKNSAIMMGNKTPLLLCFNYVVSKAFSSSNSSYIFFSLNGSIGFLRLYSLYCKIKKSLRMDWEERERERYDSLVRYIFQSFAVSENAKQALLTLLHVLTVRYARKYRVGLGPERGRWLE